MNELIRRKIDRARPAVAEGAPGADRGWRLALARAAHDTMGLDIAFNALSTSRRSLTEVLDLVPDRALLALLDGPQGGLGVMMLDPVVTATFIEMQTLGRLSPQVPMSRKASRIDAAMVAGVIDRALAGLDQALIDEADLIWAGGFRYASYLEDARPLALMLEDEAYRVLSADLALGGTGRSGQVTLVLPAEGHGDRPASPPETEDREAPLFSAALGSVVLQTDCRLDAVIGRITLPLHQIMALTPGEVLTIPSAALDAVSLETIEGQRVAQSRLGQHRGMRAVKIRESTGLKAAQVAPSGSTVPLRMPVAPAGNEEPPTELRAAG